MRRRDLEAGVGEQKIIDEANADAANLLENGVRYVGDFESVSDGRSRIVIKDGQILIAGFMVASAIMYGANMIVAAILADRD